ncbi:MAG: rod shape-determining protein MreC [Bdellovibrionaceae bacterium]|jgi:rod shape-determining protein MreC|nr:rod shape-determining protein MreC [Pseudobdellovibrionaceae bacterium]
MLRWDVTKLARWLFLLMLPFVLSKSEETKFLSYWFDRPFSYLTAQALQGGAKFLHGVQEIWSGYLWLVDVEEENQHLRKEIAEMKQRLSDYEYLREERDKLRYALGLTQQSDIRWVLAEPISSVRDILRASFWINKGSAEGIQVGQAVLSEQTIIGTIIKVLPEQSQVLLLSDRFSVIDVMTRGAQSKGLLEGNGYGKAIFKPFTNQHQLQVGDDLISTGVAQMFPRGIKVAKISKVYPDEETGLNTAEVELDFDPLSVSMVFVATQGSHQNHKFWNKAPIEIKQ